jgi:hypothetical protein
MGSKFMLQTGWNKHPNSTTMIVILIEMQGFHIEEWFKNNFPIYRMILAGKGCYYNLGLLNLGEIFYLDSSAKILTKVLLCNTIM